jgi:hypothetical protein
MQKHYGMPLRAIPVRTDTSTGLPAVTGVKFPDLVSVGGEIPVTGVRTA